MNYELTDINRVELRTILNNNTVGIVNFENISEFINSLLKDRYEKGKEEERQGILIRIEKDLKTIIYD